MMNDQPSLKSWLAGITLVMIVATAVQLWVGTPIHEALLGDVLIGIAVTTIAANEMRK